MEAIVEFSYQANEPDELEIRKGDVIKDIKVIPGGWWEGTLRDKRGMFPDNFVKVIEPSPTGNGHSSKNEAKVNNGTIKKEDILLRNGSPSCGKKYCKVLFSYDPCNEDELSLMPEDTIEFLEEVEEGWWRGKLRGRVGVFPSNFVTSPTPEEAERPSASIDREMKDVCRVLFSYGAQNEDELTLNEGEIVTIISRDVADKGWWKGEIRGKVGLFPDNFVESIKQKSDIEHWLETSSQSPETSSVKHHGMLRGGGSNSRISEKAHARKRLDICSSSSSSRGGGHVSITDTLSIKKTSESATSTISSSSSSISSSQLISPGDLKSMIIGGSSLKRMLEKTNENIVESVDSLNETGLNEELDGVERGEGAPLSHLTASRAKAPRRRLPSSQLVRSQIINNNFLSSNLQEQLVDDNLTNGSIDTVDQFHSNSATAAAAATTEDNSDAAVLKTRRKTAPWMEELKLNQMEKRKTGLNDHNKIDKVVKKERSNPRPPLPELPPKLVHDDLTTVELRQKNHKDNKELNVKNEFSNVSPTSTTPTGTTPAYVPYKLYSQLLERVTLLEEKHSVLQRTVAQLTEQLGASSGAHRI